MSSAGVKNGKVLSVHQNMARVRIKRTSSCATCSCAGMCSPFGKDWMIIEAQNLPGAREGQDVVVTYEVENELKASFILYIVPLISLILGAVLGAWADPLENEDLSAVTGGFGLLALTYIGIKMYSRKKYSTQQNFNPVISDILPAESSSS
ncbi:SoxR reducing system RseC family protein [Desulfonatronovibrio magnus]|uniref:SoxR reducing system RseC family protein n=1 Tax=Desulfonatronovibrio magnus TaxID=698827 RepID=UPI0005EB7F2A|nr:SoxR reducing system RseC family protein [Desulfonatronovibrio magnus]